MAKQFDFRISVTTNADVDGEAVASILRRLIDVGLADAQETVESGEGDLVSAELATDLNIQAPVAIPDETSVKVKHWDAYGEASAPLTHQFDIDDQRKSSGQAYITVGTLDGSLDDLLSITMEVSKNPLTGVEDVPCAHVHFDADSLAVSLFKIGDRILVRPETQVAIDHFTHDVYGVRESLYWID